MEESQNAQLRTPIRSTFVNLFNFFVIFIVNLRFQLAQGHSSRRKMNGESRKNATMQLGAIQILRVGEDTHEHGPQLKKL